MFVRMLIKRQYYFCGFSYNFWDSYGLKHLVVGAIDVKMASKIAIVQFLCP